MCWNGRPIPSSRRPSWKSATSAAAKSSSARGTRSPPRSWPSSKRRASAWRPRSATARRTTCSARWPGTTTRCRSSSAARANPRSARGSSARSPPRSSRARRYPAPSCHDARPATGTRNMKHNPFIAALAAVGAVMAGAPAFAQEQVMSLDDKVNEVFANSTGWFVSLIFSNFPGTTFPWIVAWLVIGASVFTLYFGFIQFRVIGHAIALVKGDYSDPKDAGEVSHFQALATALSGTVGLGNIAGVAVAIGIGGPGATFWMILAALLGMASKFTECTLGVKYRNEYPDGRVSGGPMYYLSKGFAERGLPGGKLLAVLFSIFCILGALGGGNMFQANQAHQQITGVVGEYPGWITGLIFAGLVFAVIVGGIKSIARVT